MCIVGLSVPASLAAAARGDVSCNRTPVRLQPAQRDVEQ
jgi:hypothetical protein